MKIPPGNVLGKSWEIPGNVLEIARTCPGNVFEFSRKHTDGPGWLCYVLAQTGLQRNTQTDLAWYFRPLKWRRGRSLPLPLGTDGDGKDGPSLVFKKNAKNAHCVCTYIYREREIQIEKERKTKNFPNMLF